LKRFKRNHGARSNALIVPDYIIEFLNVYDGFAIAPSATDVIILKGNFHFKRTYKHTNEIEDSYELSIRVPADFPKSVPTVIEIGGKIPRDGTNHINPDDTLCLGSPLRQLINVSENPSLIDFVEILLVPYLYAVSNKLKNNENFIFGELAHGSNGELSDYESLFGVKGKLAVANVLEALATKKRIANKRLCPCGCGIRLGCCKLHYKINPFRKISTKSSFKKFATKFQ